MTRPITNNISRVIKKGFGEFRTGKLTVDANECPPPPRNAARYRVTYTLTEVGEWRIQAPGTHVGKGEKEWAVISIAKQGVSRAACWLPKSWVGKRVHRRVEVLK
jgi:hypothetical protein